MIGVVPAGWRVRLPGRRVRPGRSPWRGAGAPRHERGRARCLGGLTAVALTLGLASASPAAIQARPAGRLCFQAGTAHFVIALVRRGTGTVALRGQVVVMAGPPATLTLQGSGRLRGDGKLDFIAAMAVAGTPGMASFLVSGRMDGPAFDSGFGFVEHLDGTPPAAATFVPGACPGVFPDAP